LERAILAALVLFEPRRKLNLAADVAFNIAVPNSRRACAEARNERKPAAGRLGSISSGAPPSAALPEACSAKDAAIYLREGSAIPSRKR